MRTCSFDIFRGRYPNPDVKWIEAVDGLPAAKERMDEIAAEKPGPYFVFNVFEHLLMASTDTTRTGFVLRSRKNPAA